MLTILFYGNDGKSAKARSRAIASKKENFVRVLDVAFWDSTLERCDAVEMMPDLQPWQRKKITDVYGDKARDAGDILDQEEEPAHLKKMGLMPEKEEETKPPAAVELKAVHRGGGRWFVMNGDEIISGPHDKAEAKRLTEGV